MSIERTYSKARAVGNHVVWSNLDLIPATFKLDGLPADQHEFGIFRVAGRDMYCHGFRVDFDVPAGDAGILCNVALTTGKGTTVENGTLYLNGVVDGADHVINPPVPMPSSSLWKFVLSISAQDGTSDHLPQGVTVTYHLRYAMGPVQSNLFTTSNPQIGVGFDQVGNTLEVAP